MKTIRESQDLEDFQKNEAIRDYQETLQRELAQLSSIFLDVFDQTVDQESRMQRGDHRRVRALVL